MNTNCVILLHWSNLDSYSIQTDKKNQIISKTSNQDYADGSAADYDEDASHER